MSNQNKKNNNNKKQSYQSYVIIDSDADCHYFCDNLDAVRVQIEEIVQECDIEYIKENVTIYSVGEKVPFSVHTSVTFGMN